MNTPIVLHLYDPKTEEITRTCTRNFVPWKMLKKAIRLQRQFHGKPSEQFEETDIDALSQYIIEVFGQDLTIEQLDEQSDVSEMMAVIKSVVSRARGVMDPTLPPKE